MAQNALARILPLLTLLAALVAAAPGAQAQMPGVSAATGGGDDAAQEEIVLDSPEAAAAMVARMSDEEVRGILLDQLTAGAESQAAAGATGPGPLEILEMGVYGVGRSVVAAVTLLPDWAMLQGRTVVTFAADKGFDGVFWFFALLAVSVGVGLLAEQAVERIASGWRAKISTAATQGGTLRDVVIVLFQRLLLDAGKLLVFYLVVRAILVELVPESDLPVMASIAFFLILMPRIVSAFARFVLAPNAPPLRMVRASDAFAKALYANLFIIAVIMGAAYALVSFNAAMGVPPGATRAGFWFNAAAFLWLGWVIWKHQADLSDMMRGFDEVTLAEDWAARAYPRFAMIATAACWALSEALIANGMVQLLLEGEHMVTLGILLMAPALDTLVRGLVSHLLPPMTGEGELAQKAYKATERSWVRIGRVVALAVVITVISNVWGVAFIDLLVGSANPLIAGLARFASVLIVGYIAWEGTRLWFNSRLAKEQTEGEGIADDDGAGAEGGGAGASHLSTVLPLLSWFVQVGIVVMTILIGLSNLGVDVTPLLAGAGILGLAIGFGAQKLVADVVSGLFFLIDDAFRTGEFIDIGGTVGTVEKISIRSLQLRHHLGPVHTIPYGEIPKITNYSRDWVIMKLKFTVPFDTDLNKVKKIFKQIGKDMMAVPEFAADFLQPFKSQGVLEVNDVGIVMRGKFMAKPGRQFVLRKEIYSRVQKSFDENDIQFARKEVRVTVDGGAGLSETERAQAAAAASEVAAEPALAGAGGDQR
ncbi:MAG: mechanosensitive ion channel domain-containing protein [Pseudomonadota bacterium]